MSENNLPIEDLEDGVDLPVVEAGNVPDEDETENPELGEESEE